MRRNVIATLALTVMLALVSALSTPAPALAQKKEPPQFTKGELNQLRAILISAQNNFGAVTRADLDVTLRILLGKAGYYQLEDSEGGVTRNQFRQLVPFGRKSYAKINGIPLQTNPNGSFVTELFVDSSGAIQERFFFKRGPKFGSIVVNLHVERDTAKGGAFDKLEAEFNNNREAGTFDTIQTADLVGL